MDTRCGSIAIVGAPNAGKSTLVNALVGQKVAIVSPKVQTTRQRLVGIAVHEQAQLLLVDTPGIFSPRRRLDRAMVKAAWDGATDADVIVLVIDAKAGLKGGVTDIITALAQRREPKLLVLNKVDICVKERLLDLASRCNELLPFEEIFFVSATTGDSVELVKKTLAARVPISAWHFPEDQLSDATTRLMAAELTREQLYLQLHAELPYAATIETEWQRTAAALALITGDKQRLVNNAALQRSIRHRFPYIDPLHHLQVELVRRYRAGQTDERIQRGIHISINGIAAGLRNTG